MKSKKIQEHHLSIHQRIERLSHHRGTLTFILSFMAIGLVKYETHFLTILHDMYNQGFGLIGTYAHHDEVTRMPVQYGPSARSTTTSGE
jgi:hypothetical protein